MEKIKELNTNYAEIRLIGYLYMNHHKYFGYCQVQEAIE